jgi:hypothetical protein
MKIKTGMIISFSCLLVVLFFLSNRGNIALKDVKDITLECIQVCLSTEDQPFKIKTFPDKESIKLLVDAINTSKKMKGSLDYGADFLMKINYANGTNDDYHLSISNSEHPQRGLLVKLPNTETGYTISEKNTEKLRLLIYAN